MDHADILVAVYDNDRSIRSSAGMTLNYAPKKEISFILVCPNTGVVSANISLKYERSAPKGVDVCLAIVKKLIVE